MLQAEIINPLPAWQDKDLRDREGESWKDIPGIEGYGMISNHGRVKRLAREQIDAYGNTYLIPERIQGQKVTPYYNQYLQEKAGHLTSRLMVHGVTHHISVGRIVYYCFVEQFDLSDHSIYICYKDFDRLNIRPENLFPTDLSGMIRHSMQAGRKDLHFGHNEVNQEIFSEIGRKKTRKPVHQYNLEGNYLTTFESLSAAAGHVRTSLTAISAAINGRTYIAAGYIWRVGPKRNTIPVVAIHKAIRAASGEPVSQYDLEGNKLNTYDNITQAAAAIGVSRKTISNVIHGKHHLLAAGFIWRKGTALRIDSSREKQSLQQRKGFTISQYNTEGKKLHTFISLLKAGQHAGVPPERINAMAIRDDLLLKGYIWRYGDREQLPAAEIQQLHRNLLKEKEHSVTQYSLTGKKIAHYHSITAAARATGIRGSQVQSVVDGHKATASSFLWRRGHGPVQLHIPVTPRPLGHKQRKAVCQYDLEGNYIATFPSTAEAFRQTGISKNSIAHAIKGLTMTGGGYKWEIASHD